MLWLEIACLDTYTEWFVGIYSCRSITKEPLASWDCAWTPAISTSITLNFVKDSSDENGSSRGVADFDLERFLVALTNTAGLTAPSKTLRATANMISGWTVIARHQLIQLKFADMKVALTNMRNISTKSRGSDNGLLGRGDCSLAKYYCAHAAFEVVDNALQVLAWASVLPVNLPCPGAVRVLVLTASAVALLTK